MIKIGKNKEYELSESAINHIINGDFSDRQERGSGTTELIKVISGGLHTLPAWYSFLNHRPDIKHCSIYEPDRGEKWFYTRELQNGVLLLKIPRDCFKAKAANITKFPQTYYKSGYLWKTLFPVNFTKEIIISALNEALYNIDIEESTESMIIGYAFTEDIFKAIKIRIQLRGKKILSAFPTWGQPRTGNNGKPFSHIETISTVLSASTIFCPESAKKHAVMDEELINVSIEDVLSITPDFIKNRKPISNSNERHKRLAERRFDLKKYALTLNEKSIQELYDLGTSDNYIRYPFEFLRYLYCTSYLQIRKRLRARNAISVFQNLHDILIVLNEWDIKNNKKYAYKLIKRFLLVRFIRTGGIDHWEIKRLSNLIPQIILSYQDEAIILEFFSLLHKSPTRAAFYEEFNLNPFFCKDLALIGLLGGIDKALSDDHFYAYGAQILGINYAASFDISKNIERVKHLINTELVYGNKIVKDSVKYSIGFDFDPFALSLIQLCKKITITIDTIKVIDAIVYDYHRCLSNQLLLIYIQYGDILTQDLNFGDVGFANYLKTQQRYKYLLSLNIHFIEALANLFESKGFINEAVELKAKYLLLEKEAKKIPFPKYIPIHLVKDKKFLDLAKKTNG